MAAAARADPELIRRPCGARRGVAHLHVGAAALTEDGHQGKIYHLTGGEALTHYEMAEKLSAVLDRHIDFVDVPPEVMRQMLDSVGFPAWQADGLIEDYAHYARGEASKIESGVQEATGRPPGTFDEFARDYAAAFAIDEQNN